MSGLNASFDNSPAHYDAMRDCWLNDRREAYIRTHLARSSGDNPLSLLEIGSGTGWLLSRLAQQFPEWDFHGIEPIAAYVDYARERYGRPNLEFTNSPAEAASGHFAPGQFDVLLSNDVLHHVTSEEETLRQAAQLARPGARWLAIEPNMLNPYAFAGQALKAGERNFRPEQFAALARATGWQLQERSYLFLIPPFIKQPPAWLKGLERLLEGIPFIGGGVALEFLYQPSKEKSEITS